MYNINKKVYVAVMPEVELEACRSLIISTEFQNISFPSGVGDPADVTAIGVVYNCPTIDVLVATKFANSYTTFFNWLLNEEKLIIVADRYSYERLFCIMMVELKETFGVTDVDITKIHEAQSFKEYMTWGDYTDYDAALTLFDSVGYVPTGELYNDSLDNYAFELVYALNRWGYVTDEQANSKLATITETMLQGHVVDIINNARVRLSETGEALDTFIGSGTITSLAEMKDAIVNNDILRIAFRSGCFFDYSDSAVLADVQRLCDIIIDSDLDTDSDPVVEKANLQLLIDLYNAPDITVIEPNKYQIICTGALARRSTKFNYPLILTA
jgi:hypothetical protein